VFDVCAADLSSFSSLFSCLPFWSFHWPKNWKCLESLGCPVMSTWIAPSNAGESASTRCKALSKPVSVRLQICGPVSSLTKNGKKAWLWLIRDQWHAGWDMFLLLECKNWNSTMIRIMRHTHKLNILLFGLNFSCLCWKIAHCVCIEKQCVGFKLSQMRHMPCTTDTPASHFVALVSFTTCFAFMLRQSFWACDNALALTWIVMHNRRNIPLLVVPFTSAIKTFLLADNNAISRKSFFWNWIADPIEWDEAFHNQPSWTTHSHRHLVQCTVSCVSTWETTTMIIALNPKKGPGKVKWSASKEQQSTMPSGVGVPDTNDWIAHSANLKRQIESWNLTSVQFGRRHFHFMCTLCKQPSFCLTKKLHSNSAQTVLRSLPSWMNKQDKLWIPRRASPDIG